MKKRSKRALHYRNKFLQAARERAIRQRIARLEGLELVLNNLYNLEETPLLYGSGLHGGLYGGGYGLYSNGLYGTELLTIG